MTISFSDFRRLVPLLLFLIGTAVPSFAAAKGATLEGVVLDQSGPVAGAVIKMSRPDFAVREELQRRSTAAWEMKEKITKTSPDGRFQFSWLTSGPVSITVSCCTSSAVKSGSFYCRLAENCRQGNRGRL